MIKSSEQLCTAFEDHSCIARGPIAEVAVLLWQRGSDANVLVFDDATGRVVDLDLRGTAADIVARLGQTEEPRGRGRPKLGVTAREVTLLPRHWDWLAAQPGGASAALRRLVETARRSDDGPEKIRNARTAAYKFMHALAGDFAGFETACRTMFAGDEKGFAAAIADWPSDVRDHAARLAAAGF